MVGMKVNGLTMKRLLISTFFGLFYLASVLVGDCLGVGSRWQDGIFHALFFGTFGFVVTFPLILLLQKGVRRVVARVRRMPVEGTPLWEFLPTIAMSLLFLSSLTERSPESVVERFLVKPAPPSMHEARFWYTRTFNSTQWVMRFQIAPEDFDGVLARYPYQKDESPHGCDMWQLRTYTDSEGFPVEYPTEPMVVSYTYHRKTGEYKSEDVTVYSNRKRNLVYAVGGSG